MITAADFLRLAPAAQHQVVRSLTAQERVALAVTVGAQYPAHDPRFCYTAWLRRWAAQPAPVEATRPRATLPTEQLTLF